MLKETLMFAGGVVVGAAAIYGAYRFYKWYKTNNLQKTSNDDIFAEQLRNKEEKSAKLNDLLSNQTFVELLTPKEISAWFKENMHQFNESAKMMIVVPTKEHMIGLGYPAETDLDVDTNVLQMFYDDSKEDSIKVLKTRLINFSNIDSNLQAHLIEEDGMLIITG